MIAVIFEVVPRRPDAHAVSRRGRAAAPAAGGDRRLHLRRALPEPDAARQGVVAIVLARRRCGAAWREVEAHRAASARDGSTSPTTDCGSRRCCATTAWTSASRRPRTRGRHTRHLDKEPCRRVEDAEPSASGTRLYAVLSICRARNGVLPELTERRLEDLKEPSSRLHGLSHHRPARGPIRRATTRHRR